LNWIELNWIELLLLVLYFVFLIILVYFSIRASFVIGLCVVKFARK
jgi:hypothetical protein